LDVDKLTAHISLKVSPKMKRRLIARAKREDISLNKMTIRLYRELLKKPRAA